MQIQYCAQVPTQGQTKPSLKIRSIDSAELTDITEGTGGYAALWRKSTTARSAAPAQTWEAPERIWARMAAAESGALIVLVSPEDLAAAQANHDA